MSSQKNYKKLLVSFKQISQARPGKPAPKGHNMHLYQPHPFRDTDKQDPKKLYDPFLVPLKLKSQQYESLIMHKTHNLSNNTQLSSSKTNNTNIDSTKYLTDIPLPKVLKSQIAFPSPSLIDENTTEGKIAGYRIKVTGRRGTRSMAQVVSFGRLGSREVGSGRLDFGKSHFVNKKGSSGVKVWVAYSK